MITETISSILSLLCTAVMNLLIFLFLSKVYGGKYDSKLLYIILYVFTTALFLAVNRMVEFIGILILDEPMNGLDKDGVSDIRKYLLELKKQGKTILIASHSAEDIDVLCDTVCEMDKGVLSKFQDVTTHSSLINGIIS